MLFADRLKRDGLEKVATRYVTHLDSAKKPHLINEKGSWYCIFGGSITCSETPKKAYETWLQAMRFSNNG